MEVDDETTACCSITKKIVKGDYTVHFPISPSLILYRHTFTWIVEILAVCNSASIESNIESNSYYILN